MSNQPNQEYIYWPCEEPAAYTGPDDLPPEPEPGLEPMPVDDNVITIANLMKPEAEKKLGTTFTTYTPHFYILKGGINYCIRVSQCYEPHAG